MNKRIAVWSGDSIGQYSEANVQDMELIDFVHAIYFQLKHLHQWMAPTMDARWNKDYIQGIHSWLCSIHHYNKSIDTARHCTVNNANARNVGGYRKRHNDTPSFFVPLPSTVVDTNHIYQLKRNYIHATMQTWSEFHQTNRHCGLVYLFISLTRVEEHGLDAHKVSVAQSGCWQWAVHAVCQNWTAPFEAENEDNTLQSERGQRQWVILASFTASDIWSSR